ATGRGNGDVHATAGTRQHDVVQSEHCDATALRRDVGEAHRLDDEVAVAAARILGACRSAKHSEFHVEFAVDELRGDLHDRVECGAAVDHRVADAASTQVSVS